MKIFVILITLPFVTKAQQKDATGTWKLVKKTSIIGPDYENGVPKGIVIDLYIDKMNLIALNTFANKDTTLLEEVLLDGGPTESTTGTKRSKVQYLRWQQKNEAWTIETNLSAKNRRSGTEIKIIDEYRLSPTGDSLTLIKTYSRTDTTVRNRNYKMHGIYCRTSRAKLAIETASGNGIDFVTGLAWVELLKMAQQEKKWIFVECYTTWCAPCKTMEREVFDLDIVGKEVNKHFIPIRVQMDTTDSDNNSTKLQYNLARKLKDDYRINAFPTFLFFDPDGTAMHVAIGARSADNFLQLLQDAKDSTKQLYLQYHKAMTGLLSNSEIRAVADNLYTNDQLELSYVVARQYLNNLLSAKNKAEILTTSNLNFITKYKHAITSNDEVFKVLLQKTNSLGPNDEIGIELASRVVDQIILKEELQPSIETGNPNWDMITQHIEEKYGRTRSNRIVLNAKAKWHRKRKEWPLYFESLKAQMDMTNDLGKVHWLTLNTSAWDVFEHSTDTSLLEKALNWSNAAIVNQKNDPAKANEAPFVAFLDTYANLLYKLGRREEAIDYYRKNILIKGVLPPDFYETYLKMFKGIPTWPIYEMEK